MSFPLMKYLPEACGKDQTLENKSLPEQKLWEEKDFLRAVHPLACKKEEKAEETEGKISASVSFHASVRPGARRGSLTVEAALLLPLFLFALYLFWTFFPALQAHIRIQYAMDEVTEELAQQAYLLQLLQTEAGDGDAAAGEEDISEVSSWGGEILTLLEETAWKSYAGHLVSDQVGEDALENFPVEGGSDGLSFGDSSWELAGDIDLCVQYRLTFPGVFGLTLRLPVCQHSLRKCWTGLTGTETAGGEAEEEIVYVTDSGTVYHRSLDCYHLKLTIHTSTLSQVESQRNSSGAKYYPCERCAVSVSESTVVYITEEGNRYHVTSECAGLKRSVHAVPLSQVEGMRACQNCG